jgi:hypothetical protein
MRFQFGHFVLTQVRLGQLTSGDDSRLLTTPAKPNLLQCSNSSASPGAGTALETCAKADEIALTLG